MTKNKFAGNLGIKEDNDNFTLLCNFKETTALQRLWNIKFFPLFSDQLNEDWRNIEDIQDEIQSEYQND